MPRTIAHLDDTGDNVYAWEDFPERGDQTWLGDGAEFFDDRAAVTARWRKPIIDVDADVRSRTLSAHGLQADFRSLEVID